MLFAAQYAIGPSSFQNPGLEFDDIDLRWEERLFRLTIRTRDLTGDDGESYADIEIVALSEENLPKDVEPIFANPEKFKPQPSKSGDIEEIFRAPRPRLPQSYWDFLSDVNRRLDQKANHLFGILRWRTGIRGGPSELQSQPDRMKWARGDWRSVGTDWVSWKTLPSGLLVGIEEGPLRLQLTSSAEASILELANVGEPLGQDLMQEAWRLIDSNPRSALVTCVAAVETRVKELVSSLVPHASWLLENLPSPPVDKIIREYLERLPARCTFEGKVLRPNKAIIAQIKWGIEQRNRLVHGRGDTPDIEKIRSLLSCARSLIYLLDYYAGYGWAREHLDPSVWATE